MTPRFPTGSVPARIYTMCNVTPSCRAILPCELYVPGIPLPVRTGNLVASQIALEGRMALQSVLMSRDTLDLGHQCGNALGRW